MTYSCERVEQITVFLENRPGILADLCAHLADRGVNIRAVSTLESTEAGEVRLVVSDAEAARRVLAEARVACTSTECLAIEMPNEPGGFARIARTLSLAGVNLNFIYASARPGARTALGVFGVSDLDRALTLDWNLP